MNQLNKLSSELYIPTDKAFLAKTLVLQLDLGYYYCSPNGDHKRDQKTTLEIKNSCV